MFSHFSLDNDKQRIKKKLKTCSYNYLEHKIKQEYGGGLVVCVEDNSLRKPSFRSDEMGKLDNFHSEPNISVQSRNGNTQQDITNYNTANEDREHKSFLQPADANEIGSIKDEECTEWKYDSERESDDSEEERDYKDEDSEIALSDLEAMLNEDLPERYKIVPDNTQEKLKGKKSIYEKDFVEVEKIILDELGNDHFDLLPEGWSKIVHDIGIPLYVNRDTRVITCSRPYFLGSADIIKHKLPLSTVPCLRYRKRMEKLPHDGNIVTRKIGNLEVPIAKVESVEENQISQSLDPKELYEYCRNLMPFKTIRVKTIKKQNEECNSDMYICPSLPLGTKLISFPIMEKDGKGNIIRRKEWIMNPSGKGYVAVLHEFMQQAVKVQPLYEFREIVKSSPFLYESVVVLNNEKFSRGCGNSKKDAKLKAAKNTLEVLIPELKGKLEQICGVEKSSSSYSSNVYIRTIFDDVKITDPRVVDFSARTAEPSPYSMLLTCLRRNYGICEVKFKYTVSRRYNKLNQYMMIVGTHKVIVSCKNKQDGKQKAAQTILQVLHPHLSSWGSLIRLYGTKSAKNAREKKRIEREITRLQCLAKVNSPNHAVLNKLFEELEKLNAELKNRKPMRPFFEEDIPNFA